MKACLTACWLMFALLACGCDQQASRMATERGVRLKYFNAVQARDHFDAAIELDPANAKAYFSRAEIWMREGAYDAALADLDAAIKYDEAGEFPFYTYNAKAWLRATCKESRIRDGKEAIELAEKACELSDYSNPMILDTLAAAYAEAGNFSQAVHWQARAIELADEDLRQLIGFRLPLFQAKKPYRE